MISHEPMIFVIDDDEAVRDSLFEIFEQQGLSVKVFGSAEEYLAVSSVHDHGCLLLDIHMPGLTGLELQAELKSRGITIPAIIMSGQADVPKAIAAFREGAVNFIEKPFQIEALLSSVREVLELQLSHKKLNQDAQAVELMVRQLSSREREVMDLVIQGYSNKGIARKLGISSRTVENHRAKMMEKMECDNVPSLIHLVMNRSNAQYIS